MIWSLRQLMLRWGCSARLASTVHASFWQTLAWWRGRNSAERQRVSKEFLLKKRYISDVWIAFSCKVPASEDCFRAVTPGARIVYQVD